MGDLAALAIETTASARINNTQFLENICLKETGGLRLFQVPSVYLSHLKFDGNRA